MKIKERLVENIRRYMPLFEDSFDEHICEIDIINQIKASTDSEIESLAEIVYAYISNQLSNRLNENSIIRLQDLLTCIAITSIFLDDAV